MFNGELADFCPVSCDTCPAERCADDDDASMEFESAKAGHAIDCARHEAMGGCNMFNGKLAEFCPASFEGVCCNSRHPDPGACGRGVRSCIPCPVSAGIRGNPRESAGS